MKNKLIKKTKQWISDNALIKREDRVLCAFSGGADSVAMLLLLSELAKPLGFELCAAHVNHMLRGEEALRDAVFSQAFCQRHGIGFSLLEGDARKRAKSEKLGIEEAAREMRYELLRGEASRLDCNKIATAHNTEDNLETFLQNASRGAGIKGLSGIMPQNGDVIRPVLALSREELELACELFDESYVVDSTNELDIYSRNKIRHHVLPVLKSINPEVARAVLENGALMRREDEYLDMCARELWENSKGKDGGVMTENLRRAGHVPAARVIRLMASEAGVELDLKKTEKLLSLLDKSVFSYDVGGHTICKGSYGMLSFERTDAIKKDMGLPYSFEIHADMEMHLPGGYTISAKPWKKEEKVYNLFNTFILNCGTINGTAIIRTIKPGDTFARNARSGRKSLSKLFIDLKIKRSTRAQIPIIADDDRVLWVYGIGPNAAFPQKRDICDNCLQVKIKKNKQKAGQQ